MAAQDAELKLKVSLDLGFFRQQLTGLGQAAAGYNIPVQVKFDRLSVQNELNALATNIRRRNYRLNIETNLSAEIAKADTLARKLNELGEKLKASAGGSFSRGPQGAAGLEAFMRNQGLTGRAFGVQQAQENIAKKAILSRLEKGSLSKGGYNVAGLTKIIKDLGGTPTGGRADLAAQAKKLVEESNGIADAVFDGLKDLQMKLRPIRGQAQTSASRSMPNLNEMLDRIANITENPRAAQNMLRMLPERRITTDLVGAANRQAAFREQSPEGFRLPGFNAPKAFDPLLKSIAESFSEYTKSINSSNPWVGKIGDGMTKIIAQAATSATQQQKLLPAAGQTSATRFNPSIIKSIFDPGQAAQAGGGRPFSFANRMGSLGQFPMAGMIGPSSPLSINARTSMFGGGNVPPSGPPGGGGGGFGGAGGFSNFGRALGGINLPGAGTINELGQEFAFAAKQVLLFGQAYKALAFIQNFPSQVGAAVGQLQSFRNTLNAISPTAEEAAASNRLILDLVDKYNVPLQSARDGFTKLYASMAPAGFGGDEIRNIFTGISQAAATFGLSADKVDRVNYAFAQMASKGQVMSEELKGQLGDVLPGAMAIFAEAAGFEGPKAIQDFSAALEAGQYKGEAMVALLKNVGIVLNKEFGPGAEGAARTFQGVINRLQNSIVLLYESFEPAAVGFLNAVVVPLTDGIKQISDGFNAFFTGAAAQTSGGFAISRELEKLQPAFTGIAQNVQQLIPVFQQFANVALGLGRVLLEIAGNPFVGYLLRAYVAVLPLTLAIQALNLRALIPLIASFVRAIPVFIAYTAATAQGATANKALQLAMVTTGTTAGVTATQIRTVGVALKAAFASTAIGAVLLGIGMLIEKIISLNASMADTKAKAMGAAQAIRSMSQTEARQATRQYESGAQSLKGLNNELEQGKLKGKAWIQVTAQQAKALEDAGVIVSNVRGSLQVQPTRVAGAFQKLQGLAAEGRYRQEALNFEEKQAQQPAALSPIPPGGGDTKGAAAAAPSLESYENLQDQIAKARTEGDLERAKLLFEYQVGLDRRRFELQESAANDVQKAGIKLAKELFEIETDFRRQALESRQAIVKQEGSVAPGNLPPRAPKGRAAYGPITQFGAGANANLRIGQQVGGADMQPRPVSGSERRDIVAAEKTQQTLLTERLRLEKEIQALTQKYAQTISTNFDTIFPVAQLKLQNELLAARYQLELQAVPKEAIDAQLAITEAEAKGAEQRKVLSQKLTESIAIVDKYLPLQEEGVKLTTDQSEAFVNAQGFISGYGSKLDEITEKTRGFTEAQLENAIANIKQADSLKALEEISGRINSAVEGVTGTFKGLVKEIVTGTGAVDALKKAQEALADQALTLFLDFAFKPVEDFFKNTLGQVFGVPNEEAKRKETLAKLEAQLQEQKKIAAATQRTAINTSPTGGGPALPSGQTQSAPASIGNIILPAGESVSDFSYANAALSSGGETGPSATSINAGLFQGAIGGLGGLSIEDSSKAFQDSASTVNASLENITATVQKTAEDNSENGQTGSKFKESLGKITQGIGIAASSILGIYAGISQIKEGGTGNVLSGIGSVLLSVAGGIGGIASLIPKSGKAANGAVWKGGFSAFANGGMVSGPTLGLIGEGRYNEAIVPLPNGRSIPVQLNGGRSARDVMGNGPAGSSQGLAIDMKFETTKINGVEYVSREQLEAAMAETRKKAARDGATQGSQLALNKIKNSPNTRRQLGM